MEMYWNSEPKVATNVFELGLKLFSEEPDYVLRYLEFLIEQNNANSVFHRSSVQGHPADLFCSQTPAPSSSGRSRCCSRHRRSRSGTAWPSTSSSTATISQRRRWLSDMRRRSLRVSSLLPLSTLFMLMLLRIVPSTVRFAQKHQQLGLEGAFSLDLGPSFVRHIKPSAAPGSPALDGVSRNKRGHSAEPDGAYDQDGNGDAKRARRGASPSPAPAAQVGGAWQGPHRQSAPQAAPALNRAQPFMLDPMGRDVAILPDAVVFFLSLLPPAASFNGPHLNPATIMDIIGTTILPGSAPGPGLPGERLGIPPRPKPQRPQYGGGACEFLTV